MQAPAVNPDLSSKERPFGLPWLDSSYLETLLPAAPWQNVSDILSQPLAEVAREQFSNEHRKQMIIELVGTQFKRSYLTDERDYPWMLYPPTMTDDQRRKLENEAKSWLQIKINETALDKNCAVRPNQSEDNLSNEMKDFLEHTYHVVMTSMDRFFYIKQTKLGQGMKKKPEEESQHEKDFDAKSVRSLNMLQKYASKNTLKEALKSRKNNMTAIQEKPKKVIGELSGDYSEMISDSLLYILRKDPRRIGFVIRKLIGQQLPKNLRQFIWSDILFRNERRRNDSSVDIEIIVRKNFAAGVTRGKNELKLKDPAQTPVSSLIENAVIETYSRVIPMQLWLEEHHLRQTMKILNVLYTYSRDYEPYYIYWLLPFQLTYSVDKGKSEVVYDMAMYLDLYAKNCFPSWNEVFTISGKVMTDLSVSDPQFFDHLKFITKKNTKVNPKDFVNELIYNEGKKAGNYLVESTDAAALKVNKDLLGDPVIFLRKWIGETFAGILNPNALLYVWDQLFMSLWASVDIEVITKAILYLLRTQFMRARDYDEMRRVFLEEPCKLYTSDIQSAFMHLTSGGREGDVAALNRRDNGSLTSRDDNLDNNPNKDNYKKYLNQNGNIDGRRNPTFEPIALKGFKLILIVPKQGLTSDFDPSRVTVGATLYHGQTKLSYKSTEGVSLVKDIKSSLQETKTYDLEIPEMILFDLSQFENEISLTSNKEIFIFLAVKYISSTYSDVFLGYCKVPIYQPQKIGSINTWDVILGNTTRLLHPGAQPFELFDIPDNPRTSYKERLGPNSSITFTVINPRTDEFLYKLARMT